jgi:hypothetical protein
MIVMNIIEVIRVQSNTHFEHQFVMNSCILWHRVREV